MENHVRRIILASQSPRRKELLAAMGLVFEVLPSNFHEQLNSLYHPALLTQELALGKAMVIARQYPEAIIIGSDTIVTVDGRQLEKPISREDARRMHSAMSNRGHLVTTSVAVICIKKQITLCGAAETLVVFKPYDEAREKAYLDTGDYADKAGGYGIQNGGRELIDYIEGDYDTVIGLPTKLLTELLHECGLVAVHPAKLTSPVTQLPRL
jgi:septum formation protein